MKKAFIGTLAGSLLLVPLLVGPASADPADYYVEEYSDEEAQGWYEFSKSTSGAGSPDESQNATTSRSMRGPVTIDDSDSNDSSEVSGNTLPVVGNDILGDINAANDLLGGGGDNNQTDSGSSAVTQTRSEDNDASHSATINDSFNTVERLRPAAESRPAPGKSLPTTGADFSTPLALALFLISAGWWLVMRGRLALSSLTPAPVRFEPVLGGLAE